MTLCIFTSLQPEINVANVKLFFTLKFELVNYKNPFSNLKFAVLRILSRVNSEIAFSHFHMCSCVFSTITFDMGRSYVNYIISGPFYPIFLTQISSQCELS